MNKMNPNLMLELLASILGGAAVAASKNSENSERSREIAEEVLDLPDEMLTTLLSSKPFIPLSEHSAHDAAALNRALAEVAALDADEIGEVILVDTAKKKDGGDSA